jgi:hypothetical protein
MKRLYLLFFMLISIPLLSVAQTSCPTGASSVRSLPSSDQKIHNIECYDPNLHSVIWSTEGVFNNTQQVTANVHSLVNGVNPTSLLYKPSLGCCSNMDAIAGGISIPSGATVTNGTGLAGYVVDSCAAKNVWHHCNGVALFGNAVANASGTGVWGMNVVVTDTSTPSNPLSGHGMTGLEIDMSGSGKPAQFRGIYLIGSSTVMPPNANGIEIASGGGKGQHWGTGITIDPQATDGQAMQLYPRCALNSGPCDSQFINFTAAGSRSLEQVAVGSDSQGDLAIKPVSGAGVTIGGAATAAIQTFNGTPSGRCANTTLGINAAAQSNSAVLYVCLAGTSTWSPVSVR